MPDNITALANTGTGTDVFATDDIGGVNFPRTKLVIGADGVNDGDVSRENPMPVEDERVQRLLGMLLDALGVLSPDTAGRLRVTLETQTISGITTVTTVSSVTTVTTVSTVTNQAQIGGLAANQQIPILNLLGEDNLRRNIVFS